MPRSCKTKPAILIIHGFTGSPQDARELTAYLERSLKAVVAVPCLPGHGSQPEGLFRVTRHDWYQTVLTAYDCLADKYGRVAIIGVSFGANLMFKLASERQPAALIGLGTPVRLRNHWPIRLAVKFMKLWTNVYLKKGPFKNEQIPGYRQTAYDRIPLSALEEFMRFLETNMRPNILRKVTAPTLLVESTIEPIVAPGSRTFILQYLASKEKHELIWNHHRHLLIVGGEAKKLFAEIAKFLRPYLDK